MYTVSKIAPASCEMPDGSEIITYIELTNPMDNFGIRVGLLKSPQDDAGPIVFPKGDYGTGVMVPQRAKDEMLKEIVIYIANIYGTLFVSPDADDVDDVSEVPIAA